MELVRRGRQNVFWSIITIGSRLLTSFFVFFILARQLSVEEFGAFSFAYTLAMLVALLSDLGLDQLIIRDGAARTADLPRLLSHALVARSLASVVSLMILGAYLAVADTTPAIVFASFVLAAAMAIGILSQTLHSGFQSQQHFRNETNARIIEDFLLLAGIAASFFLDFGVQEYAGIWLVAKIGGLAYTLLKSRSDRTLIFQGIQWTGILSLCRKAFSFWMLALLATSMTALDTFLLRELSVADEDSQVAIYQTVIRLILLSAVIPQVVSKGFLPTLSRARQEANPSISNQHLRQMNDLLMTLGMISAAFVGIFAPEIVRIVYGTKYVELSAPYLSMGSILIFLRFGAAYNLFYTLEDRVHVRVLGAALGIITLISAALLLVPKYGISGLIVSSIVAHLASWSAYIVGLRRTELGLSLGWNIPKAILLTAGLISVALLGKEISSPLAMAGSLLYLCFAVWLITPPQLRRTIISR